VLSSCFSVANASNCRASDNLNNIHQGDSATPSDCTKADKRDLQLKMDSEALKPIGLMMTNDEFESMWKDDLCPILRF